MNANRPITMSLPLGLFSTATMSAPLPKISKSDATLFPLDRELLDMPAVDPDEDATEQDLSWL